MMTSYCQSPLHYIECHSPFTSQIGMECLQLVKHCVEHWGHSLCLKKKKKKPVINMSCFKYQYKRSWEHREVKLKADRVPPRHHPVAESTPNWGSPRPPHNSRRPLVSSGPSPNGKEWCTWDRKQPQETLSSCKSRDWAGSTVTLLDQRTGQMKCFTSHRTSIPHSLPTDTLRPSKVLSSPTSATSWDQTGAQAKQEDQTRPRWYWKCSEN